MDSWSLPICKACGTQYHVEDPKTLTNCKICDDPRQMVPPTGQAWTTYSDLRKEHKNTIQQDAVNKSMWSIWTEPKFGIGQRAIFFQTPKGNILWDLISLLDDTTRDFIHSKGGLAAIVISHPHFYTTHAEWAKEFNCPVYVSVEDMGWLARLGPHLRYIKGGTEQILEGVTAIKCGGHFDGSLVLHHDGTLFIADTLMTVPSGLSPQPRPPRQITYSFLYSIPNAIQLPPSKILRIWQAIKPYEFHTTHGNFIGMEVRDKELKKRVLYSMHFIIETMRGIGFGQEEEMAEMLLAEKA